MTPTYRRVIGIDMAVDRRSVAVARATWVEAEGRFVVDELAIGADQPVPPGPDDRLLQTIGAIAPIIRSMVSGPTLVAMDAPLGWPAALATELATHVAGRPLSLPSVDRDQLFVRRTDREITERFGRVGLAMRPLEVGADRIARTAQAALALLHAACPGAPVLWPAEPAPPVAVVETYPAATLAALRGSRARGYKGAKGTDARVVLFASLIELAEAGEPRVLTDFAAPCRGSDHALDAVVCALGGIDVAQGRARAPDVVDDVLRREGWIWVRDP
ncbi:MAG: DUF429 domain-containing protein [Myxococcota bacterium]